MSNFIEVCVVNAAVEFLIVCMHRTPKSALQNTMVKVITLSAFTFAELS